jgi:pimeloyl-ACP methyl ester carboxylesterase
MDRVDVDGLSIAYRRAGKGPLLVLLHGALSDSRDWRRQMDSFGADFTVIAWDAPGCGGSDDLPPTFGLDDYVDTLARFIDVLHLGRPHLLGLSLGGILAIALHGRHPDVARSLVLASAYAGWAGSLPPAEVQRRVQGVLRDLERPVDDVAREFVATLLPPDAPAPLVQEQLAMIHDARPATTKTMLAMITPVDLRPVLPKIDVPALLLYGDADVRAPTSVAEALHDQIRGSVLVTLAGVGHCGHVQAPDRWNSAVLDFLRGIHN